MKVDNIPVLGKIKRTLNALMINFILLAVICIVLGIVIPFFPKVLDVLVGAFLIVAAVIFLNIAYHVYTYKKKYLKFFGDQ
ncbi:hypothetical protein ACFL21_02455 [Patescibacteria group bacterium]